MTNRATEKIIEALAQLLEGFAELQESLETELGVDDEEDDDDEEEVEGAEKLNPDSATVSEMRSAVETVIENEDYTPEEIANLIGSITEALEEIDPNIFDNEETEEEEEEVDDDEDYDDDDDDYEEDEDEEFEEDEDE